MTNKALVRVADSSAVVTSSNSRRGRAVVTDSSRSPYAPGALRATTDAERARLDALTRRHPELERLGYEGLRQVASGYLDDADLALRGELREAGVPIGWHREDSDDVNPRWSDEGFATWQFVLFGVGVVFLAVGIFVPVNILGAGIATGALLAGAALVGASFGEVDGEENEREYR